MFERYTEKARRVIFFARYETSSFGSHYIETEHLLLGILREDKKLTHRFLRSHAAVESIRKQVEANTPVREKISTSVDLPLSNESKRVLAYAAEEAERLGHKHIGTEHLFLGLLREEKSFAAELLNERGVNLAQVREQLARVAHEETAVRTAPAPGLRVAASLALSDFARDLTQAAMDGQLDPLIGRERELDAVIEILSRNCSRSVLLIGERGSGKSAVIDGLAQRIADRNVPAALLDNRLMAMDTEMVTGWALLGRNGEERLNQAIRVLVEPAQMILFIDDFDSFVSIIASSGSAAVTSIFKNWILRNDLVCMGACTPSDYEQLIKAAPWVCECFTAIHILPLDEQTTLQVLQSRKHQYETFHGVKYADDALEFAAGASASYLPGKPLPGKAMELLDAAGARVRARLSALPGEITEIMKKQKSLAQLHNAAVQNHEFEKARILSDEERQLHNDLQRLREKHHLDDVAPGVVTRKDVEDVIAQAGESPFAP